MTKKHGMYQSPEYLAWARMKERCQSPSHPNFKNYGGRGITICERWSTFESFYADMGPRPGCRFSLDRIDNSGNYEPENCRWATRVEQCRNRRTNTHLTHLGRTLTIVEWSEVVGLPAHRIAVRVRRGWPDERALTEPMRAYPRAGR